MQRKVALVTGASRGLGLAIASRLLERGLVVCLVSRTPRQAVSDLVARYPDQVQHIQADVSIADDIERSVQEAMARWGRIDVLVNNAALVIIGALETISPEQFELTLKTNLTASFRFCHQVIPIMRAQGGGCIINVSSFYGLYGIAGGSAYCSSKAGLVALSEALSREFRDSGIKVSTLCPVEVRFNGKIPVSLQKRLLTIRETQLLRTIERIIALPDSRIRRVVPLITPMNVLHLIVQDGARYLAALMQMVLWLVDLLRGR